MAVTRVEADEARYGQAEVTLENHDVQYTITQGIARLEFKTSFEQAPKVGDRFLVDAKLVDEQ